MSDSETIAVDAGESGNSNLTEAQVVETADSTQRFFDKVGSPWQLFYIIFYGCGL